METDETTKAAEEFFAEGADKKPTLKMSEVIQAMREQRIEMDCKAVLMCCDEDKCDSLLNLDLCAQEGQNGFSLMIVHNGCAALAASVMQGDPAAAAVLAKFAYRQEQISNIKSKLSSLLDKEDNADDGKEGESHE